LNVIFYQNMPNLHNRYILAERKISQKNPAYMLNYLLSSPFVRRLSVNISHFNLLRNHWANCSQTLVEWSLDGPLPKWCPVIPPSNQDGRQAKNRKRGDEISKKSSLKLLRWFQTRRFLWEFPIGSYFKLRSAVAAILVGGLKCWTQFWKGTNHLLRNHWANCNQTLVEWPASKIVSGDPDFQPRWPLS
jgi:hypothetical protein